MQEVVYNALRHARASALTVQLICHEKELSIVVVDNGYGFDANKVLADKKGSGIKSVQSWVAFLNGQVFFDSCEGKGTTVTIEIPLLENKSIS